MADSDSGHWVKAMKTEMESIDSNQVWKLVEPPANIKLIGCKWVYMRKRESDGKVETFKARLVAKWLSHTRVAENRENTKFSFFLDP